MKKILALVLALVLVLASCAVAFAANDGSLTVSNTTADEDYVLYKVFDATYNGNKVAYTYDGSNATFLSNLQNATTLFTVTENLEGTYNVVRVDGASDADVIAFIKNNASYFERIDSKKGNGAAIKFSGLDYGYYFVSSTVGTAVTIDSALKDVTVIDKNQTTDLDKEEKVANGTWVYDGDFSEATTPPSGKVGDTVEYKLEGQWTRYIGEDIVKTLKFHDVMTSGLTADQNVVVKFNGNTLTAVTDYTVTYTHNADDTWVTDISIPVATITAGQDPVFLYDVTNTYEITYSAKIDADAIVDGEELNTVDLKYDDENGSEKDIDDDKTKVKTYEISLLKVDGKNTDATTDDSPLAGAKFALYAKNGTTAISVVLLTGDNYGDGTVDADKDNTYRLVEAGETGTTELVVGKTGKIVIKGLANGEYEFEETEAPKGYNKMTTRTDVAEVKDGDPAKTQITAINNSGTELPSTGGIGTTIFYILGGLLVVGAAVILVARRKAQD